MEVIVILILASLSMALMFLGAFVWSVRTGQFDDTTTPAMRVLMDGPQKNRQTGGSSAPEPGFAATTIKPERAHE